MTWASDLTWQKEYDTDLNKICDIMKSLWDIALYIYFEMTYISLLSYHILRF